MTARCGAPRALVAVMACLLLTAVTRAGAHRLEEAAPPGIFSLADLREHLSGQPAAWVGREVLVRARAEPCPWWGGAALHCGGRSFVLVAADPMDTADPLPVERSAPQALLVAARRVPLLGRLLPPPRAIPWFAPASFRVRIQALPAGACGQLPCYEALVLAVTAG